jgi:hypothetical protein
MGWEMAKLGFLGMRVLAIWPPLLLFVLSVAFASITQLPWPLRIAGVAGLVILPFDMAARLRDFTKVVARLAAEPDALARHVGRYKRSWCQRTVLLWAATAALGQEGRAFVLRQFAMLGYRWYHVFPDHTWSRESPFLKFSFWRGLLGGTPEVEREVRQPAE